MNIQAALLDLLAEMPDRPVTEEIMGSHVVAIVSRRAGLSTWAVGKHPAAVDLVVRKPRPGDARGLVPMASGSGSGRGVHRTGSPQFPMLPLPADSDLEDVNAGDLLLQYGADKNIAVIGHFPFVQHLRSRFANVWVLEKQQKPGDLPADAAEDILPRADVVAITATTLANQTLSECLQWIRPDAMRFLVGPSTPLTPALFDAGFDVLAGSLVEDMEKVRHSIRAGLPFKAFAGVRHVVWTR